MKIELRDFQKEAVRQLLARLENARLGCRLGVTQAVGLTSTTGAGKTVIAAAVIEAMLVGSTEFNTVADPEAVFLWMTDLPDLNAQTIDKIIDSSDLRYDRLVEVSGTFNDEILDPGKIYVLNTQKLNAKADLVKKGPLVHRNFTFWDVVRRTIEDEHRTLYLVVDEAHRGMTEDRKIEEANSIIQRFIKGYPEEAMPAVPIVVGISATPARFQTVVENAGRTVSIWPVPPADVRASGLIKDRTLAEYAGENQTDAMAMFPEAVRAWKEATDQWAAYQTAHPVAGERAVIPALIVQVENEGANRITLTPLDTLVRMITDIAGPLPDSAFAHAFGEGKPESVGQRTVRYVEPPKISRDTDARVIFFKTSLGTGWDCPRAEVLFSFRRSIDPTTIAQTIGRMVRTPLARRVDEDERLNTGYVFLPHYNETAVKTIVTRLNQLGNEGVAAGFARRNQMITLTLRRDADRVVEEICTVPTYQVPAPRQRAQVRTLLDLANFLSRNGIDPAANAREIRACAEALIADRAALEGDVRFDQEVDEQGTITVRIADLAPGTVGLDAATTQELQASEESIGRLYGAAGRKLTNEIAAEYVRRRLPTVAMGRARLEVFALSTRTTVLDDLNRHAFGRIDALRQSHGRAADGLAPSQQRRYREILRQASDPSVHQMQLSETIIVEKGTVDWAKHLYVDARGEAPIKLNRWEGPTIQDEIVRPETLGWLRNTVDREGQSFCIPWRKGNDWAPFFPDFLVVRQDGEGAKVDIFDPHDHDRSDAVAKAKGLSAYAARHADVVGHVDLIAKVGDRLRRLHLEQGAIRAEVDRMGDSLAELRNLYLREG